MAYLGKTRTPSYFFHASTETIEFAKGLRMKMTPCEKILWERLRRKNIRNVKFRRQHPNDEIKNNIGNVLKKIRKHVDHQLANRHEYKGT